LVNAVGVCATFNGPSGREFDQEIVPDAEQALALRLLWGYFVDSNVTGWKDFVLNCAGPAVAAKVSLSPVLKLVEQDCGPDRHVIVCVDELMLCAGGRPEREVTDTANAILGSFGSPVLDNQAFQRVHVAFQALDTSLWETGRPARSEACIALACPPSPTSALWLSLTRLVQGGFRMRLVFRAQLVAL